MKERFTDIFQYWKDIQRPFPSTPNQRGLFTEDIIDLSCDFLPLTIAKSNEVIEYKITINDYMYLQSSAINAVENHSCYFIEKARLRLLFLELPNLDYYREGVDVSYYAFTEKIESTANALWESHLNREAYNLIWLYVLVKQLWDNYDKTNIEQNVSSYTITDNLKYLYTEICKYAEKNNIELPTYNRKGSLIIPRGLIFQSRFHLKVVMPSLYEVIDILFNEMQYIKANYYMCVIKNDIQKDYDKQFGKMMNNLNLF